MATDIIARGMITEYKSGTNISFKENDDGSVTISASGDVSSEDTVARETIDNHKLDKKNPHNVTAEQVGLNNVDNTADLDKPISTAVQTALDKKVDKTDVQDNLESTDTASPLSANQGKILNEKIVEHTDDIDIHVTASDKENWNGYVSEIETNKADISRLFDITKGGEIVSNESSYTINNAVDYPLLGLSLYGKSTQDGTPTPDNPVDIVSVGDKGFDIVSDGGNEFAVISCRNNSGEIITSHPVSVAVMDGDTAAFTVAATGTGLTYLWQYSTDGGSTWKNTSNKTTSYNVTVKQVYDGYKYRCIVTDENGNSETSNVAALYIVSDDCTVKTGSIVLPDVLCGIPVSEGGNYTDSTGQQWVCDELVYNADGTGRIVKRTAKIDSYNGESIATPYISTTGALTTGATVIYQTDAPQEIPLTAADVSALMQLKTYNGVTNITNSDGADMDVKYCTNKSLSECVMPITTALQAQIDELKSAVLSLGGNI